MTAKLVLPGGYKATAVAFPLLNVGAFVAHPLTFPSKRLVTSISAFKYSCLILCLRDVPKATPRPATFWSISRRAFLVRGLFGIPNGWLCVHRFRCRSHLSGYMLA